MKEQNIRLFDAAKLPDELGQVRAEMKELADIAKGIEHMIKLQGDGVQEGDLYRTTVTTSEVKRVDWQKIAKSFEPSKQKIAGNTTWSERTVLKLSAHKK